MINLKSEGEILIAEIIGEIDHHTARVLREEIDTKIIRTTPTVLVLDFEKVTFMDSSGIGLIMGRYKLIHPMNGMTERTDWSSLLSERGKLETSERCYSRRRWPLGGQVH